SCRWHRPRRANSRSPPIRPEGFRSAVARTDDVGAPHRPACPGGRRRGLELLPAQTALASLAERREILRPAGRRQLLGPEPADEGARRTVESEDRGLPGQ